MQKLVLPIPQMLLTAGYRNQAYRNRFGFAHYGQDAVSSAANRTIYACGQGKVLAAGMDNVLGNVLILLYPQVQGRVKTADLVMRHFHLESIAVRPGDQVSPGTPLGTYGNTGRYSTGAHLHTEVDFDVRYYAYSATGSKTGTIIKAGTSTTMCSPADIWQAGPGQLMTLSKARYGGLPYVAQNDLAPALNTSAVAR